MVKLGTNLPEHLIGTDHGALAEFLQGIEELGYGYITIGDHVLGADLGVRPEWKPYQGKPPLYDQHMAWHEPLVLFGYLSAITSTLELSTGILVAPQRQAALLAKQAAEVDILSGGRLRLVIAAGWNDVEFEGMGVDFAEPRQDHGRAGRTAAELLDGRSRRLRRQVPHRQRRRHQPAAGTAPDPAVVRWAVPGRAEADGTARRRLVPVVHGIRSGQARRRPRGDPRERARRWSRPEREIGIEGAIYFYDERFEMSPTAQRAPATLDECVEYARWWKDFGATRYWVTAPWANLGPEETGVRTPGKKWSGVEARLDALRDFAEAVGPDF